MILVNISAVGTSTTLTLQPVACSHFGPEKFRGSSDWSPASHTMVMVLPAQIFLAASAARCAALCASATAVHTRPATPSNPTEHTWTHDERRRLGAYVLITPPSVLSRPARLP